MRVVYIHAEINNTSERIFFYLAIFAASHVYGVFLVEINL